jgi:hypothetical protein
MALNTPVLFCIFNRPDLTRRVWNAIARQRPRQLLVAADGPRPEYPADGDLVQQCRDICRGIDWPCQVETFFRESNRGCRRQMAEAIGWAFAQHERLIILEDDCLPDDSFFRFCEILLARFASDERVMMISGDNFQPAPRGPFSYYFSRYSHIWGWASWRRAWQHFDLPMRTWPAFREAGRLREVGCDDEETRYWTGIFDRQHAGQINTWDYSWAYACWQRRGLTVLPQTNLVSNIGFRADGTHTRDPASEWANREVVPLRKMVHPAVISADLVADEYTWRHVFRPPPLQPIRRPPARRFGKPYRKPAARPALGRES